MRADDKTLTNIDDQTFKLSKLPVLLLVGMKLMFGFFDSCSAIAWAASNFFISIWVPPYFRTDSLMSLAASASASDRIIWAVLIYSSRSTINFCLSANCCCTALLSTALEYSLLNPKCMKLTSATLTLNYLALANSWDRIYLLTVSLCLRSWSASSIHRFTSTLGDHSSYHFLAN